MKFLIFTLILSFHASNSFARQVQDGTQQQIIDAVSQFLHSQLSAVEGSDPEITVQPPDPRLRLAECPNPLSVFYPPGRSSPLGNVTVGVKCDSNSPWKLYISARTQVQVPMVTATSPIPRGTQITAADLSVQMTTTTNVNSIYYSKIEDVTGMVTRTQIVPNRPISANQLKAPKSIKRGESVLIQSKFRGITVAATGIAMDSGAKGDIISVKNIRSNKVVDAIILKKGVVTTNFR